MAFDHPTKTINCVCGDKFEAHFVGDPIRLSHPCPNASCPAVHTFKESDIVPFVKEWHAANGELRAFADKVRRDAGIQS